jgi:hypothetical protein
LPIGQEKCWHGALGGVNNGEEMFPIEKQHPGAARRKTLIAEPDAASTMLLNT